MSNLLVDVLSAEHRKVVYAVYALVGLVVGAFQVGYGAVDAAVPAWLKVTLAVYAFVGTAIGATAASNVKTPGGAGAAPGGGAPRTAPPTGTA